MGTRTARRAKSKQIQRRKRQRLPAKLPAKDEFRAQSATSDQSNPTAEPADGQLSTQPFPSNTTFPSNSPTAVAERWAQQGETCSTIKQVAVAALILGQNVSKTAVGLGVDRRTIQRWQKLDPEFQLAMAETKQEVVLTSRQSLLALAEEAVQVVDSKLNEQQDARVALSLLRNIGVLSPHLALELPCEAALAELPPEVCISEDASAADADTNRQSEIEFRAQSATLDQTSEAVLSAAEEEPPLPELESLPLPQQTAAYALFEGKPLANVAALVQTDEATVRGWLCRDIAFFNALSTLQFDRINQLKFRLLNLCQKAIYIVRAALQEGNGRIALALLRGLGMLR